MVTFIFIIMMFAVFGKLLVWGIKAAWGITKLVCTLVFLPIILIALFVTGFVYLAIPILLIVGIIALIRSATT